MCVNKVILVGNLGADPELRDGENLRPFCTFSVATTHSFKNGDDQRQSRTEWHHIVCFGAAAQNSARFLKKGRQVYIEGRIQTQKWQDKEGAERISNRIVANNIRFLGSKPSGNGVPKAEPTIEELSLDLPEDTEADEDIPF